ncbi:unnamed protein product, partial [Sphacelaria rigidula]
MSRFQVSANSLPRKGDPSPRSEVFSFDDLPDLRISAEEEALLDALIAEAGQGTKSARGDVDNSDVGIRHGVVDSLPVEWVVDIADKDNDWFVATAYAYNDTKKMVHVMVPDNADPTWEGDIPLNPIVLRLLECCDGRSMALFKQVVRDSALEIDWSVRVTRDITVPNVQHKDSGDPSDTINQ